MSIFTSPEFVTEDFIRQQGYELLNNAGSKCYKCDRTSNRGEAISIIFFPSDYGEDFRFPRGIGNLSGMFAIITDSCWALCDKVIVNDYTKFMDASVRDITSNPYVTVLYQRVK